MRVIVPALPVERFSVFCCKKASKLVKYFFHYFLFYFPISNFFFKSRQSSNGPFVSVLLG